MTTFEPKPTLKNASVAALQAGAFGIFFSTVQNALGNHSHGAMGVFTRTGGTIGFFGTSQLGPSSLAAVHRNSYCICITSRNGSNICLH